MRLTGVLAITALVAGCWSMGGEDHGTPLEGVWGLERADGCALLFRYRADQSCVWGEACRLEDGGLGLERHEGTCDASGGVLEASWERSTCESPPRIRVGYEVDGDQLTIDASDARLLFERLEEDGEPTSGVVRYGCWDGDTLVFNELRPL